MAPSQIHCRTSGCCRRSVPGYPPASRPVPRAAFIRVDLLTGASQRLRPMAFMAATAWVWSGVLTVTHRCSCHPRRASCGSRDTVCLGCAVAAACWSSTSQRATISQVLAGADAGLTPTAQSDAGDVELVVRRQAPWPSEQAGGRCGRAIPAPVPRRNRRRVMVCLERYRPEDYCGRGSSSRLESSSQDTACSPHALRRSSDKCLAGGRERGGRTNTRSQSTCAVRASERQRHDRAGRDHEACHPSRKKLYENSTR
jgi:hypothetical protein